jgi:hypothetical protein
MNIFLIRFRYTGWCQGPDDRTETILVYADSFHEACMKLKRRYGDIENIENLTLN